MNSTSANQQRTVYILGVLPATNVQDSRYYMELRRSNMMRFSDDKPAVVPYADKNRKISMYALV